MVSFICTNPNFNDLNKIVKEKLKRERREEGRERSRNYGRVVFEQGEGGHGSLSS